MWKLPALMLLAMSLIPLGDAAGKLMTQEGLASPLFVAWSRFAVGAVLALPLVRSGTLRLLSDWRLWLRAALLVGGITSIQTALQTAPLGDVFAAFFIGPIVSFALSSLVLREQVTALRSAMMGLGFVGVLMVVRPGGAVSEGIGFAVMAGTFYGAYLTSSRWLAAVALPGPMLFLQLLMGAVMLTPFALGHMPEMSGRVVGLTLWSAVASAAGNGLLIYAYTKATASELAPYVYFQLASAVALGWLVFGDLPDPMTWLGLAVIAGAGLVSARVAAR